MTLSNELIYVHLSLLAVTIHRLYLFFIEKTKSPEELRGITNFTILRITESSNKEMECGATYTTPFIDST